MLVGPGVHRLVTINDREGRDYRSRVEDVHHEQLILARPFELRVDGDYASGTDLTVSWPDPAGLIWAGVRLLGTRTDGRVATWVVQVIDGYHRKQRRRFVRVPAAGKVELTLLGSDAGPVEAYLLDVSEAALRCAVRTAQAEVLGMGAGVVVSFSIGSEQFRLGGYLDKIEPSPRQQAEIVLSFAITEREADGLRRLVFAEQLRARNG